MKIINTTLFAAIVALTNIGSSLARCKRNLKGGSKGGSGFEDIDDPRGLLTISTNCTFGNFALFHSNYDNGDPLKVFPLNDNTPCVVYEARNGDPAVRCHPQAGEDISFILEDGYQDIDIRFSCTEPHSTQTRVSCETVGSVRDDVTGGEQSIDSCGCNY
uniref:SUEL-type lectin domain-containing protein n=1 Tax=Odontella aurita TaxID=265563 RepID=A0A7S4I1K6_9STRA|mmetsp:Transcript_18458/g.53225  ORF Transcript_18458/g.53225 Transcript_18458/m.53225 type:complete len:160 (+) Transcript_18458:273-752(+)|eukprot:CAMPEP_0113571346 /NCGR_PEP_ID=MMETSP0015_2-20120614/25504_1 /TAXON_ID=2838 /ORGANISM="Odontella" /LENGTH=159 /DNA_ID=CAMNT_0000474289 /DNA_START=210 /DNA_END=689 /DNA_ORIENTATION=+ /assembly_acc=CAM_ASM_000160